MGGITTGQCTSARAEPCCPLRFVMTKCRAYLCLGACLMQIKPRCTPLQWPWLLLQREPALSPVRRASLTSNMVSRTEATGVIPSQWPLRMCWCIVTSSRIVLFQLSGWWSKDFLNRNAVYRGTWQGLESFSDTQAPITSV